MERKASAVWQGGLKDGSGKISTDSKVLSNTDYSFGTRFEGKKGTNPEELIAAAHAGCFSMALSAGLGTQGYTPTEITTSAVVTLEKVGEQWMVTTSNLDTVASIPGIDASTFDKIANEAKAGCPISKLLNAKITLSTRLERS